MNCKCVTSIVLTLSFGFSAGAAVPLTEDGKLTYYGDARLRYEVDWDSVRGNGSERGDRHRMRARLRSGLNYKFNDQWNAGVRLRTGESRAQQSPHLTFKDFSNNPEDTLDFVVDKYFVNYAGAGYKAWAGRNSFPFWKQNELFWDDDVTPTGVASSMVPDWLDQTLTLTVGGFYLPDGGYDLHGQMLAGQVKYAPKLDGFSVIGALGLYYMHGEDDATNLRNGNGERDYIIGGASLQLGTECRGLPLTIGGDVYYNFEDYSSTDANAFTAANHDEVFGAVLSARVGKLKERNDWLVGYYYSYIEALAVNASYAQDDWFRFGSGGQTDSSDFKGHEFRLAYNLLKNLNAVARLYLVDAITSQQDGKRFRLDLNLKF